MEVVVFGLGCSECHSTAGLVERVANKLNIPVHLTLNESKKERERLGIHTTPAVAVDGQLVHSRGIPSHEKVAVWLMPKPLDLLKHPTRHLFFTGKGGVGKTSLSTAVALHLANNDQGASCLGPHSGLKMQEIRFKAALDALSNPALTSVILVTRPDKGAIAEASRTSDELKELGLNNQRLVVNGVFHASDKTDVVANAFEALVSQALDEMPGNLRGLPQDLVPLRAFDTVGLPALRALLSAKTHVSTSATPFTAPKMQHGIGLAALADELAQAGRSLIMVMGKGGVGKTTVAAALALGLVQRGKTVHLSTTDPAAHLAGTLEGVVDGLRVDRIDPQVETQRYVDKIMATKGAGLNEQERALMLEDLKSPCTEEVAVFHAFSRVVSEARSAFVVLDTAPTGHSMLLMDATGAYHRQMLREFETHGTAHFGVDALGRLVARSE